jgi:carbon storage regulator
MIVFSRKKNDRLVIGNNVTVTVVELHKDGVRLGIVAPREVSVHRGEVYDAIRAANEANLPIVNFDFAKTDRGPFDVVERLAKSLSEKSKRPIKREMVVQAILEAVAAMEENLGDAASLDELKQRLMRRA